MSSISLPELFLMFFIGTAIAIVIAIIVVVIIIIRKIPREVTPATTDGKRRLVRIPQNRILGGVCSGFAYKLGWPVWLIRVIMVIFGLMSGMGVLVYIILWLFMPRASGFPQDFEKRTQRY